MIYKKDIINFLFTITFPLYGFGNYISATKSPSAGFIVSVSACLAILVFYLIDFLYRREFRFQINVIFFLVSVLIASNIVSLVRALLKDLPEETWYMTTTKSIMLVAPFMSFVVVTLYNGTQTERVAKLLFTSLSILLFINLVGFYVLGLSNETHSIENRLNFPFLDGFYSGAGILSIINLMIIFYLFRLHADPLRFTALLAYFGVNLYLLFLINSRIAILMFLMVACLLVFKVLDKVRGMFLVSLFTVPILLVSGTLVYEVLKQPVFVSMIKRVDIEDITTFNGRSYIWEDVMHWLLYDQRGLLLGNGYKGHYFLDLISDVAKRWNEKEFHHMHLHSSSFEMLTCQGIAGFSIYMFLFYKLVRHFRRAYQQGSDLGIFFAVSVFLLFILQVDTFVYLEGSGFVILSVLLALMAVDPDSAGRHLSEVRISQPGIRYVVS